MRLLLLPLLLASGDGGSRMEPRPDSRGEVSEVRITAERGGTTIRIVAGGEVEVRDFLLEEPARLVLDVEEARHALPGHVFDGLRRGAVLSLRSSQFREDVVRLVFDLREPVEYTVVRRGGIIEVRLADGAAPYEPWSTAAAGRWEPTPALAVRASGRPRISVTYDSAGMLEVLAGFAELSGASIVPGEGAADRVVRGVAIRDEPWDVALEAVLRSQGLGWRRMESGILLVEPLSELRSRDSLPTETRVLRINYAGADSVASVLEELASPGGRVVPYRGTNSIVVTDVPSLVSRMDSLVRLLDRRTPQVSIEAKIVFVDRTSVGSLGIGYSLRDDDASASTLSDRLAGDAVGEEGAGGGSGEEGRTPQVEITGEALSTLANAAGRIPGATLRILAATAFGDFSLFAFLDALATRQLTDVKAAPVIQVVDNERARIQVGEDVPVRVLERAAGVDGARATVRFEPTGIILEVTPHVTHNGQVLLDIRAERSGVTLDQPDVGFTVNRQIGETRVLVDDGETAVIGGLTRSEVTESASGIPGLMDLPVVGSLFRTRQSQEMQEDLIILVTPRVTTPPEPEATPSS